MGAPDITRRYAQRWMRYRTAWVIASPVGRGNPERLDSHGLRPRYDMGCVRQIAGML